MAIYCVHCGSPLSANGAFCPHCGKAAGNREIPVASSPNPTYAPPVVPAAKGGSALKIIVVVLCCLLVAGAAIVGGVFYVAYRVKQAVVQKAENGVDLHSIGSSDADTGAAKRPLPKVCELLSKEDVARLIGEPIERTKVKDAGCEYYGPPGLSAKLAQQEASDGLNRSTTPGADARMNAIELQRMLNRAGAQAGNAEVGSTGSGGELPLLVVGLSANGKSAMSALSLGKAIFGVATNSVAAQEGEDGKSTEGNLGADVFVGTDVGGLGDKAMWTPKLGLYVLHGDILIQVDPGPFHDANTKSIAIARAVLSKI